ncbi:MAG: sugar transferase, partial [Saprospiraceae bacterium]
MTKQRRIDNFTYRLADFLTAMIAWACFFLYRKKMELAPLDESVLEDQNFWFGIILIPVGWVLFYSIFDKYQDIYRLSRLATLTRTLFLTFIGVIFLFFTLILDDFVPEPRDYYHSFGTLFLLHFSFTAIVRMILLTRASRRLKAGLVSYNTIIIGGNQNALELYEEIA